MYCVIVLPAAVPITFVSVLLRCSAFVVQKVSFSDYVHFISNDGIPLLEMENTLDYHQTPALLNRMFQKVMWESRTSLLVNFL